MATVKFNSGAFPSDWHWETLQPQINTSQDAPFATLNPLKRMRIPEPDISADISPRVSFEPPLKKARLEDTPRRPTTLAEVIAAMPIFPFEPLDRSPERSLTSSPLANRYVQEDIVLGEGAEGRVVRGRDLESGFPVALKFNHLRLGAGGAIKEAKIFKQLAAKNTPHRLNFLAEYSHRKDEHVIVTELIPEKNINQAFIVPGADYSPLTFSEIITIGRQCLEFLASLKSQRLKHIDLRIDNMIFERESRYLTVLDYRRCTTGLKFPYECSLQVLWQRSPEELLGADLSASHDLWTLGCVLYEIFTRTKLFHAIPKKDGSDENRLVRMMVQEIGFPSQNFLLGSTKAYQFFNYGESDSVELLDGPCQILPTWKASIRLKRVEMGLTHEQSEQFIQMLERMVCWENRLSAQDLLKLPLFKDDLKFHVSSNFSPHDVISLYRYTETLILVEPAPSLRLYVDDHVTRTCCHIQRDPQDLYYLHVHRGQELIFNKLIRLKEGDLISI